MSKATPLLFCYLLFAQLLQAVETPAEVAVEFSNTLVNNADLSGELSLFAFADGVDIKKKHRQEIGHDPVASSLYRASQWNKDFYLNQIEFKVLDTKVSGPFAVSLVSSIEQGSPVGGAVHRICMVKKNDEWKIAPMISNFTYAYRKEVDSVLESDQLIDWATKKEIEHLNQHLRKRKKAFENIVNLKKREILSNALKPEQMVSFFFKQIKEKSIAGLCAVSGYTVKNERTFAGQNCEALLKSFYMGVGDDGFDRGAWSSLLSEETIITYLKTVDAKNGGNKYVLYSLLHPEFDEFLQVVSFEVIEIASGQVLKIPEPLIAHLSDKKYRFNYDEFNSWNLPAEIKGEWDNGSLYFFENSKKSYSKSVKQHNKKIKKARKEENFKAFMSYYSLPKDISGDDAYGYLVSVCESFKRDEEYFTDYRRVFSKHNAKKTDAIEFNLKLDYEHVFDSNVILNCYHKTGAGWTSYPVDGNKEILAMKKSYGDGERDMVKKFLENMSNRLVKVDLKKEINGSVTTEQVEALSKEFLQSLMDEDIYKLAQLSCDVSEGEVGEIQKFFHLQQHYLNFTSLEVISHRADSSGFASFAIKGDKKGKTHHFMHFAVKSKEGLRVDSSHIFEFGKITRLTRSLNEVHFRGLNALYPESATAFFAVTYQMMDQAAKK